MFIAKTGLSMTRFGDFAGFSQIFAAVLEEKLAGLRWFLIIMLHSNAKILWV